MGHKYDEVVAELSGMNHEMESLVKQAHTFMYGGESLHILLGASLKKYIERKMASNQVDDNLREALRILEKYVISDDETLSNAAVTEVCEGLVFSNTTLPDGIAGENTSGYLEELRKFYNG
jgi:hypothetical protein